MPHATLNPIESKNEREEYLKDLFTQLCCQASSVVECETLEIKNWCSSEKQLAEKASESAMCLANLRGGCVLLGIENEDERGPKFSKCPHVNVTTEWLTQRVHDNTVPPVEIKVVDASVQLRATTGKNTVNCFAIFVAKAKRESGHQTVGGLSKIRSGKECRPYYVASPDDRTRAIVSTSAVGLFSPMSIAWGMQQYEKKFGVPKEQWEGHEDFLTHLGLVERYLEEEEQLPKYRVTLAGLLLFGTEDAIKRNRPGIETVVTTPLGEKRIRTNIVETYRYLCGSNSSLLLSQYPNIPVQSIRELVVNAFVHRSYRDDSPAIIRADSEALEIETPGQLSGELSTESLLYCIPVYRNFLLAEGARFLGICDKVGKGINKVYEGILQQGLGFPIFENGENHFTVRVFVERNREFREFLKVRAQSLSQLDEIIVLRFLLDRESGTYRELCSVMQRGPQFSKRILDEMARKMMIEPIDSLGTSWQLRPAIRADIQHIFNEAQYSFELGKLFGE
jgi:ATP-dependent DNA helicase RecG